MDERHDLAAPLLKLGDSGDLPDVVCFGRIGSGKASGPVDVERFLNADFAPIPTAKEEQP